MVYLEVKESRGKKFANKKHRKVVYIWFEYFKQ